MNYIKRTGKFCKVADSVSFGKYYGHPEVEMGDCVEIGENVHIAVPKLKIGDYAKIHRDTTICGEKECTIGHNFWCGEKSMLNTTGGLTIGNNVSIGTTTQIWTHARGGELIEGCNINSIAPVVIQDGVWLCGSGIVVNPRLVLGEHSIVLPNSTITKGTFPFHIYGGNPAEDLTEKLNPYSELTDSKKTDLIDGWIDEYNHLAPCGSGARREGDIIYVEGSKFNWRTKKYTKHLSQGERYFMWFMIGDKIKFLPE